LFQIVHTALLFILLSADLTLGTEKQVKLEDIERDNLRAKQVQLQQQQEAKLSVPDYTDHQQLNYQAQQQEAKPSLPDYTGHQQLNFQAQQQEAKFSVPDYAGQQQLNYQAQQQEATPIFPDYTGHQQLNYQAQQQQAKPSVSDYTGHQQLNNQAQQQQISLQPTGYLHGLQPQVQFQAPPSAGAVALYLAGNGLAGNYLGITPDAAYQSLPQQIYLPQGDFSGLQFVQVPPSPFIYSHQPAPPKTPEVAHSSSQKESPSVPLEANPLSSHSSGVVRPAYQRPSAASADTNFVYTPQQAYNPIPKELQSYTTIPDTVYQGKEPDFLYDQQPSVSITHDGLNQYNALYRQPKPKRPIFSSGVKSAGLPSLKTSLNGGRFLTHTPHFPGLGISYSSYRQGPGAF
jgi:hypothetical protein